ncbi:hypothetical protein SLE2022_334460 [Rubroshorea leprosula]
MWSHPSSLRSPSRHTCRYKSWRHPCQQHLPCRFHCSKPSNRNQCHQFIISPERHDSRRSFSLVLRVFISNSFIGGGENGAYVVATACRHHRDYGDFGLMATEEFGGTRVCAVWVTRSLKAKG